MKRWLFGFLEESRPVPAKPWYIDKVGGGLECCYGREKEIIKYYENDELNGVNAFADGVTWSANRFFKSLLDVCMAPGFYYMNLKLRIHEKSLIVEKGDSKQVYNEKTLSQIPVAYFLEQLDFFSNSFESEIQCEV